jgi:hypothetical protein
MQFLRIDGRAVCLCAAVLLTAGCGGSSQSVAAIPQGPPAIRQAGQHSKSWILPGSSSGDLIYATGGCGGTCVISYPALKYVGAIPTAGDAICSDSQGNVFLPSGGGVTEYAHGGTQPIATLSLNGSLADGCSVDPKTNNLAVVFKSYGGDIAVFPNEQGKPALYDTGIDSTYCGYDDSGNLFVNGYGNGGAYTIAELPAGLSTLSTYRLDNSVGTPGQVQWDGKYITYESLDTPIISRLKISGSKATIVGTVTLKDIRHTQLQSWIYDGNILVPYNAIGSRQNDVGVWKYPKGGKIVKSIRKFDSFKKHQITFEGVALSVQP